MVKMMAGWFSLTNGEDTHKAHTLLAIADTRYLRTCNFLFVATLPPCTLQPFALFLSQANSLTLYNF